MTLFPYLTDEYKIFTCFHSDIFCCYSFYNLSPHPQQKFADNYLCLKCCYWLLLLSVYGNHDTCFRK